MAQVVVGFARDDDLLVGQAARAQSVDQVAAKKTRTAGDDNRLVAPIEMGPVGDWCHRCGSAPPIAVRVALPRRDPDTRARVPALSWAIAGTFLQTPDLI